MEFYDCSDCLFSRFVTDMEIRCIRLQLNIIGDSGEFINACDHFTSEEFAEEHAKNIEQFLSNLSNKV